MSSTLLSVALIHWVVLVTPGANVLVVSQLAASGYRKAAFFAAFGVTTVAVIWAILAVFGVNAVFVAHPHLQLALLCAVIVLVFVNALCWHIFLALAFSQNRVQRAYERQRTRLNRIAGVLVGLFGIRLILDSIGASRRP